jgi:transcriptional regulator with XRE-family HTH domain
MIDSASRNNYYEDDNNAILDSNQEENNVMPKYPGMVERIQDILQVKNQKEVAEKLGISSNSVTEWKKKGFISSDTLLSIHEISGASISWILTGKGAKYAADVSITQVPNKAEDTVSKAEKFLKENSLVDVFLQLLERFEMMEARLTALESVKETDIDPLKEDAQVAIGKGNSLFAIAEKTTEDQWKELCALSGENVPLDAMVAYVEYHKRGNQRFLTHYTKHIQDLITAYKENRLEDYLSEQAPGVGKEAG